MLARVDLLLDRVDLLHVAVQQVELIWFGFTFFCNFKRFLLLTVLQELDSRKFSLRAEDTRFRPLPLLGFCFVAELELDDMLSFCLALLFNVVYVSSLIPHWSNLAQDCAL